MAAMASQTVGASQTGGKVPAPTNAGWSKAAAHPGDEVQLCARLIGYGAGTQVTFKVFSTSGDSGSPIATLAAASGENGCAHTTWAVRFDVNSGDDPSLVFEASTPEGTSISPVLSVIDRVDVSMREEGGHSIVGLRLGIVDGAGDVHHVKIPANGRVVHDVSVGDFALVLKDHLVVGEELPGKRRFSTGRAHEVTWKKMTYTVEVLSPRDGEVYVVGDRIEIETSIKRAGKPEKANPAFVVSGQGALIGGADAGQGAARGTGDKPVLALKDDQGEVTLEVSYMGAKATVTLQVIRPFVKRLELVDNGGNLIPVFDHETGSRKTPFFEFAPNGKLEKALAAAAKLGTKLKAQAWLSHKTTPSHPTKVDLALLSGQLKGGPAPGPNVRIKSNRIVFRVPAEKAEDGVEITGEWGKQAIELEADRELPASVQGHELKLEARLRVKGQSGGWSGTATKPKSWTKVADLEAIPVFAIWDAPEFGDGSRKKPGAAPLKERDFDRFHLFHATRWAAGKYNLLPDGDGSILKAMLHNIGHYRYPEDYKWKDGKKAGHPRPDNLKHLTTKGISAGQAELEQAPAPDDKVDVEISRRGGKAPRNAATDMSIRVVTSGAMQLDLEMNEKHTVALKVHVLVDGKEKHVTDPLGPGAKAEAIELGPVSPGPHTVTISPAVLPPLKALFSWKGKATAHFSKPKPGEAKPQDKNWGWTVLDNPTMPGGRCHQAASALAAALGTLGVKASVNVVKARPKGAINLKAHDPVTAGSPCFDPHKHWGQSMVAFVAVPADSRRNNDPALKDLKPLHTKPTLVLDLRTKKIVTAETAGTTGHRCRMPKRGKLVKKQCRCGHAWPPEGYVDWVARIKSGAAFDVALNKVPATKKQWGTIVPGATYRVRFHGPDTCIATGPTNEKVTFKASLDGAFWSFSQFPSGKGKRGHRGKFGKHMLHVDQAGKIHVKLDGGRGTYKIFFYKNDKQAGPMVATCGPNASRLQLTRQAKDAGWRQEGRTLVPPDELAQGGARQTAGYKNADAIPEKMRFNIWGHVFQFDNTGAVTDPGAPELGVVGKLGGAGMQAFQAGHAIEHHVYPMHLLAAFRRRFHHWFTHKVTKFQKQVKTDGRLGVLAAVPRCPRHVHVHMRVFVDGKLWGAQVVPMQRPVWFRKPVKPGGHTVRVVMLARGHGHARHGVAGAVTIETEKQGKAKPRRCLVCGAQPTWGYRIDREHKLKDALIQSIIYPCPKCEATVHEEDRDCWACGEALELRDVLEGWKK